MNEKETFEDILNQEIRWPCHGDDPFAPSLEYSSVTIPEHEWIRPFMIVKGYEEAAGHLVDKALETRHERESLIFPILFLYRHYIEIQLKYFISTYGRHANIEPNWTTHDLVVLWREFEKILDVFQADDVSTESIVRRIVAQFAKMDPQSFSYRYPCDRDGNLVPIRNNVLDLKTLKDVMNGVVGYFEGCDSYFHALDSAYPHP